MKIRNRVFINDNLRKDLVIELDSKISHYLFNVLRCQEGEHISIFNNSTEWLSEIIKINSKSSQTILKDIIKSYEEKKKIILYFSPIKRNQTELIIQKCTEIGVTHFQPIIMERTNIDSLNINRLHLIAIEATEQSGQIRVPEICKPIELKDLLLENFENQITLVCLLNERKKSIKQILHKNKANSYALLIGPEGDFSENEIKRIINKTGFFSVSLGETVLKSETAAITAVSILKDFLTHDY